MVHIGMRPQAGSGGVSPGSVSDAPVFAALDLGTNNCRLLVARPAGPAVAGQSFRVIDAFSRVVRLGDRLALTGELAMTAMDRTV